MNETPEDRLARIRREYFLAKQSMDLKNLIEDKRDLLENTIQDLRKEIEAESFNFHRKQLSKEENGKESTASNGKSRELLESITRTKRELDARLDNYEVFTAEMLVHLKKDLIDAILGVHPELKNQYQELTLAAGKKERLLACSEEIASAAQKVEELLEAVSKERSGVKKSNIFRYLFGNNPNYAITSSLHSMKETISNSLPAFDKLDVKDPYGEPLEKLSQEVLRIFKHLLAGAEGRWGWNKLDKEVIPYYKLLQEARKRFQIEREILSKEVFAMNAQLNEWIDRNSQ